MRAFSAMIDSIKNKFSSTKGEETVPVELAPKPVEVEKPKEDPKAKSLENYQHLENKLREMSDPQYESVMQAGKKLLDVMNQSQKPSPKPSNNKSILK